MTREASDAHVPRMVGSGFTEVFLPTRGACRRRPGPGLCG
ncbi:PHP-associated domain-containing protein [Streptomyces sp. NPDC000931]